MDTKRLISANDDVRLAPAPSEMLLIGFAMAGFFDGVLLHQVLQWHHVLSLAPGPWFRDPGVQIAADGAFHVVMYLFLAAGLVLLWRRRRREWRATQAIGGFLMGFGIWQCLDVVVLHWVLGLHHVRLDVRSPLVWDLAWVLVFGATPLWLGWRASRLRGGPRSSTRLSCLLAATCTAAGMQAARPPQQAHAAVLFASGERARQVMAGVADARVRLVDLSPSGHVAIVGLDAESKPWRLYRHGALVVGASGFAGCAGAVAPAAR